MTEQKRVVPYDLLGGEDALLALVEAFYRNMKESGETPMLKAMHSSNTKSIESRLFKYLSSWLGGPSLFMEERGSMCITDAHRPFTIGRRERDEWIINWNKALEEIGASEEVKEMVREPIFRVADMLRNVDEDDKNAVA